MINGNNSLITRISRLSSNVFNKIKPVNAISILVAIVSGLATIHTYVIYVSSNAAKQDINIYKYITLGTIRQPALFVKVNSKTKITNSDFARMYAAKSGSNEWIKSIEGKIFAIQINSSPNSAATLYVNGRKFNINDWILFDERNSIVLEVNDFPGLNIFGFSLLIDKEMTPQQDFPFVSYGEEILYIGDPSVRLSGERRGYIFNNENVVNPYGGSVSKIIFSDVNDACDIHLFDQGGGKIKITSGFSYDFMELNYFGGKYTGLSADGVSRLKNNNQILCAQLILHDGEHKSANIPFYIRR